MRPANWSSAPVIPADEPTASLDAAAGETIAGLLLSITAGGERTLLAVSHDPVLIARLDDRLELAQGNVRLQRAGNGECR